MTEIYECILYRIIYKREKIRVSFDLGSQTLTGEDSSRIFIAMLHLYGTRGDTNYKVWAKIISAHTKKCSRMKVSVAEGRWVGQKRGLCSDLSGHERKTGRLQAC